MSNRIKGNSVPDRSAIPSRFADKSENDKAKPTIPGGRQGVGAGTGPHEREGRVSGPESLQNGDSHPSSEADPQHDNMGVVNDNLALTGYQYGKDVERIGYPTDYFYKIAIDTLQLTVRGNWLRPDGCKSLIEYRERSKTLIEKSGFKYILECHDGHQFEVFPHGARPGYQVLLRDKDGQQIRAVPGIDGMPAFIIRFGARWCTEYHRSTLEEWIVEFLLSLGFEVTDVFLSDLHLRVDVPIPFTRSEISRIRGTGTRNSSFTAVYNPNSADDFEDFSNRGEFRKTIIDIYNKRLEQKLKPSPFWKLVWAAHGIDNNTPIWRVEIRMKRPTLKSYGLSKLSELTDEMMQGLWYDVTREYFYLVDEPDGRADRIKRNPKWLLVQDAGVKREFEKLNARTAVSPDQLLKQAAGCIASYLRAHGAAKHEDVIDNVTALIVSDGYLEYEKESLLEAFESAIEDIPEGLLASGAKTELLTGELLNSVIWRLRGRLGASHFGKYKSKVSSDV